MSGAKWFAVTPYWAAALGRNVGVHPVESMGYLSDDLLSEFGTETKLQAMELLRDELENYLNNLELEISMVHHNAGVKNG